jgi:hypothetical protein
MVSSGMLRRVAFVRQEPHCVTSQKTPFFIVTAVKTSNLIYLDSSLETAIREPALSVLRTSHVPNLIIIFRRLSKE